MKKAIISLLSIFAWIFAQEQDLSDLRFLNLSNSRVYIIMGADGIQGLYVHPYGMGRFSPINKSELIENGYTILSPDKNFAVVVGSDDTISKKLENGDILVFDDKAGVCRLSYIPLSKYLLPSAESTENCDSNLMNTSTIEIMKVVSSE